MSVILVFAGGALGAMARLGLGRWIGGRVSSVLPVGTFVINITGCLFIGWLLNSSRVGSSGLLLLDVGFTGAFTTFSTFSYETLRLVEEGEYGWATLNIAASLVLGLLGVSLGAWLGQVSA